MNKLRGLLPYLFLFLFFDQSLGQENADSIPFSFPVKKAKPTPIKFTNPTLGLGTGMFTFYGDVANNYARIHPMSSRVGYTVRIMYPISRAFDFNIYSIFGKLAATDNTAIRRSNFESTIRTGGINLGYNFNHLLHPDRVVSPYITLGLESFEFLSKTDLADKNGNEYYYWNDGSIRNVDENDPAAGSSMYLYRDYNYESDLREQNLDGLGKYQERSWAIPLGFGAKMDLSPKVKFFIGSSMHFTFTDLIDNVTGESVGDRVGSPKNDRYLFSYFTLSYNFEVNRKGPAGLDSNVMITDPDLAYILYDDEDADGVPDIKDEAPHTPKSATVEKNGVPEDNDKDGIGDYRDIEPTTTLAEVDEGGVGITDDFWLAEFNRWEDSTGRYSTEEPTIIASVFEGESISESIHHPNKRQSKKYMIQVGSATEGISANDIARILSYSDVRTIVRGDTILYVLGNYSSIHEALARKESIIESGLAATNIIKGYGDDVTVRRMSSSEIRRDVSVEIATDEARNASIRGSESSKSSSRRSEASASNERPSGTNQTRLQSGTTVSSNSVYGAAGSSDGVATKPLNSDIVLRVQIGAFRYKLSNELFAGVPNLLVVNGADGVTRYFSGTFKTFEDAAKHKLNLQLKGYEGAFIVAYKAGRRIGLEEAGAIVSPEYAGTVSSAPLRTAPQINKSLIRFRIQVGAFRLDIPTATLDKYLQLGNVQPTRKDENGITRYVSGSYASYQEAMAARKRVDELGIIGSFVIGEYNNKLIPADEAIRLQHE